MPNKSYDEQIKKGNHLVPQPEFCWAMVGSIGAGKSTCLLNVVLDKDKLFRKYDRIVLFSPTITLDEKMKVLVEKEDLCRSNQKLQDLLDADQMTLDDTHQRTVLPPWHGIEAEDQHTAYYPEVIQSIIDTQTEVIQMYGKAAADRILLIIDDAPALGCFSRHHGDLFNKFTVTLRHYKVSILMAVQMFKTIPKLVRTNLTALTCWETDDNEMKEIFEVFSLQIPFYRWQELVSILTNKQYEFVTFNKRNAKGSRMIKNFDEYIA